MPGKAERLPGIPAVSQAYLQAEDAQQEKSERALHHLNRLCEPPRQHLAIWQPKDGFPVQLPETFGSLPVDERVPGQSVVTDSIRCGCEGKLWCYESYSSGLLKLGFLTSAPHPRARMTAP